METEPVKNPTLLKKVLYITGSLVALFMIYYAVMSLLSPGKEIAAINEEYGFKEAGKSAPDIRIFSDSTFIALNRDRAFYQARVLISESDSIGLALNLHDSTAILEINGVAVHKAKVTDFSVSKVLNKADEYAVTSMLAAPLTIESDYATIMKEPVMLKVAPKDTSEYKPDVVPDTTSVESVNYRFDISNGLRLYVFQNTGENNGGSLDWLRFDLGERLRNFKDNLKSISSFKVPDYHPYIKIKMDRTDAKIIYRALPKHGQIALFR
jgi:hypothetical protein